ncbi:MAG: bifunctional 4-hydroxy-2-oxoglutarate aldolase/2-dehydro-3-deoxy-phosphogluconate aldolase [Alphaproteobacteria bacterium]|nr:MAG: bifunctional 4-hydroxy-2-oxoglutarate aldolase/2-dehydro-3-deoxy-phosphogluconate aldolase [Alphaproteobacteria bacterium]
MATIDPDSDLARAFARQRILPVLTMADAGQVPPLAEVLRSHGLTAIEVTLRTPAAWEAIRAFLAEGDFIVGVGTVRRGEDLARARAAGAAFAVAPGMTDELLAAATESPLPFVPAAATPSEMMTLAEAGFRLIKFFPAAAMGRSVLEAVRGPLPELRFLANGGIGPDAAADWLALETVLAVGGSWVAPSGLLATAAFGEIGRRLHAALQTLP